jgi:tRNA-modifying protein YgfZ
VLKEKQLALGGIGAEFLGADSISEYAAGSAAEYSAGKHSAGLMDRSWLGRIDVSGADRFEFLHRMSTNDIHALKPGDGLQTVLTTPEAKIIELLTVYAKPESLLCVTNPQNSHKVLTWFKRNMFFRDKVKAVDISALTVQLSLFGPLAGELLARLSGENLESQSQFHTRSVTIAGFAVQAARLPGLAGGGYDLIADAVHSDELWDAALDAGRVFGLLPLGTRAYNALRLEAGEPLYGYELSEEINPLEAGLKHAISFAKGCYTGQEVIARLDTYQKLKQTLVRLRLSDLPEGSLPLRLWLGTTEIGKLTSAVRLPESDDVIGLGYVRIKFYQPGIVAVVDGGSRTVDATMLPPKDAPEVVAA